MKQLMQFCLLFILCLVPFAIQAAATLNCNTLPGKGGPITIYWSFSSYSGPNSSVDTCNATVYKNNKNTSCRITIKTYPKGYDPSTGNNSPDGAYSDLYFIDMNDGKGGNILKGSDTSQKALENAIRERMELLAKKCK